MEAHFRGRDRVAFFGTAIFFGRVTPYVPTWKERLEDAKPYLGPAVAALLVLIVAGWVVWHQFVARGATKISAVVTKDAAALQAALARLSADVDTLEKTYQRAIEAGATSDATALLNRAIEKQRERLKIDPEVNPDQTARLAKLESLRASSRSATAAAQSVAREKEALAATEAGRSAGVIDELREALRLQREANANATAGDAQDFPREARLAQAIELAEAEPLHAAVENALSLARAAVALEHWDDALTAYAEARAAQAEINQTHPTTRYANLQGLDAIDAEIASLQAAGLVATIAARERDGEAATAAGRAQEAAASFAAAAELQRQVNQKFPRSRFAAPKHVDELTVKRDTVLSSALIDRATMLDREIATALARRQTVSARDKILEATSLVEKAATEYPSSRTLDRALQFKLGYLALRRTDLDALQREIYEALAPVPGFAGRQMLKAEVAQDFYARVMNANPSRNTGRMLPVDSVSWFEAQEFCQRLTWLLGRPVRLPSEAEMRAAFGAGGESWSAETSDGHSHEAGKSAANAAGFSDLAGNVAEWLQPAGEPGETAPVAGGSYLDPAATLATLTITPTEKHERTRHVGFRVVVEVAVAPK